MADMSALLLSPDKHPFQLQCFPGPKKPYEVTQMDEGLLVRLDMPGVAPNGIKIFKSSEKDIVTFSATAPKKQSFPYDESERLYAGIVQLNKDPNDLVVEVSVENGSVILFFPAADGYLVFLPQSRSQGQGQGEGSSSEKSIDQAEGSEKSEEHEDSSEKSIDKAEGSAKSGFGESASDESVEGCNSEGLEKSEENEDSSEKSIDKAEGSTKSESGESASNESSEGLEKSEENEDSSKKSIDKAEGSAKSEAGESASGESTEGCNCEGLEKSEENEDYSVKSIDKAEGSAKSGSDDRASDESTKGPVKSNLNKSSSDAIAEAWIVASIKAYLLHVNTAEPPKGVSSHYTAWIVASIKAYLLHVNTAEPPKEESALVETSPTEQSNHGVPEIEIGSVVEMDIHSPHCQCQRCDSDGICVKTWSTTENKLAYINKLKIKGPDGVCEKRVVQEGGHYSLYVRADLPGFEPPFDVVTIEDRCILVFGEPQSLERCRQGTRIYLFFVQLQCSCCKLESLCHDYEDGVLRLFCKIIAPEPGPSAD